MNTTDIYRTQAVTTAGPAQLVLMLFDRALLAVRRARQAGSDDQPHAASLETINHELQRAQDILGELQVTLDHDRGGQIAANLHGLYGFCLDRLITANVRKDVTELAPVENVLGQLRDAWEQACCAAPLAVQS